MVYKGDVMDNNLKLQFDFDEIVFYKNDIMILYFGLSNIIYFITMLFGCIMPLKVSLILASFQAMMVALIELSLIAYTRYDYKWYSVARMLSHYPTKRINIRISRYRILLRYMVIELAITAIPMIAFFYYFDIVKFITILTTVAFTMGIIGIIGIELSMRNQ
jgi:magnesium-transporting ATPase (P-type)